MTLLMDIRVTPRAGRQRDRLELKAPIEKTATPKKRGPKPSGEGPRLVKVTADMNRKTVSRFASMPLSGKGAKMPSYDLPAIVEGRTMYPGMRRPPLEQVLKPGGHFAKIGGVVLKGRWMGMPIVVLTLEERATCPKDCMLWRACYGNGMNFAHRFDAGAALERRLAREVAVLAAEHPAGFVVRLHALGDFYSVEYVDLWRQLLDRHEALRIFGYTARWKRDDAIGQAVLKLAYDRWDRFAVRFSNAPIETCSTITIEHVGQKPADAILCPEQLGKTESCSTCALCWQSERRIAFIRH